MRIPSKKKCGFLFFVLILSSLILCWSPLLSSQDVQTAGKKLKVCVAFGFHVNLYHSFRGDTNDDNGFGKDIANIRHIIKTLNQANGQGIPVRASWDFDNHFSLEHLLPKYAPDIIPDIRQRVAKGRDEVLLMSYNNGLASAMNRRELTDAVSWSISNRWGSGVKDLFPGYTPVVRPQEMMTTPGNFDIYKASGVEAVALYYSAVPFDAFRVFSRHLTREQAHNPLTYMNDRTGEQILVIPTYNVGDLVENVSLRKWVQDLRHCQKRGQIRRDVLLFINFDADSDFWKGIDCNWPVDRLPNTGGLENLIQKISDLDYVTFTSLKDYLADHGPAGVVKFQQDTADGSFDGYSSWAGKKQATDYWTRIDMARRFNQSVQALFSRFNDPGLVQRLSPLLEAAYLTRLKALSTTNFGMATPFLAPQRETAMQRILADLNELEQQIKQVLQPYIQTRLQQVTTKEIQDSGLKWVDTLLIVTPDKPKGVTGTRFINLPVSEEIPPAHGYYLKGLHTQPVPLIALPRPADRSRFYIAGPTPLPDGLYLLCQGPRPKTKTYKPVSRVTNEGGVLTNRIISVEFDHLGKLKGIQWNKEAVIDSGSTVPYFRYENRAYRPEKLLMKASGTQDHGTASLEVTGKWEGPDGHTVSSGSVDYVFSLIEGLPYLFIDGRIRYPGTSLKDVMNADVRALSRQLDLGWQETAPVELRFLPKTSQSQPIRILKHNFIDVESAYELDYYKHSKQNLNLDNVNNHITDGYIALVSGKKGLALGVDKTVASNFAFAPLKVRYDRKQDLFSARINPFGTYSGRQYRHPTWGNRQGFKAAVISGEQFHSSAPTFNGENGKFSIMLGFFDQGEMTDRLKKTLLMYSAPAIPFSLRGWPSKRSLPPIPPDTFQASFASGKLTLSWENRNPDTRLFKVLLGEQPGRYSHVYQTFGQSLTLDRFSSDLPFESGKRFYALIKAVGASNKDIPITSEISLDFISPQYYPARAELPLNLYLELLWANLKAAMRLY